MLKIILFALSVVRPAYGIDVYQQPSGDQTAVYEAEGHWVVDRFAQAEDGWPEQIDHEEFDSREEIAREDSDGMQPMGEKELLGRSYFVDARSLWAVTHEWDANAEEKYSQWIEQNFTVDFFSRVGFATACSDVKYALRWIFARDNGLPAANRLITGEWFTSRSLRDSWRRLPTATEWYKDKRFLAALGYLTHHTFTHTLWNDSYPIAIEAGVLVPGAFHLNRDSTSGHTMIITKVSTDPNQVPIETLSSTTPRAVREMNLYMYSEKHADPAHLALMKMRWPSFARGRVSLTPAERMPGFSTEQFAKDFVKAPRTYFWEEIFSRVSPNLNPDAIAVAMRDQIQQMFRVRQPLVNQGYAACRGGGCREGGSGWEDWSTVSRDQRLGNAIEVFDKFLARSANPQLITANFAQPFLSPTGQAMSFTKLLEIFRLRTYSSDPADIPLKRWGIIPVPPRDS